MTVEDNIKNSNTYSCSCTCQFCKTCNQLNFSHQLMRENVSEDRLNSFNQYVESKKGTSTQHPERFVIYQAAERYFKLLQLTQDRLKGQFSESEFKLIYNSEPATALDFSTDSTIATSVAIDLGIQSPSDLGRRDDLAAVLVRKLMKLTPLENVAIADACEQFWRGNKNPLL